MDPETDPLAYDIAVGGVEHLLDLMPLIPPEDTKRKMLAVICACIEAYRVMRDKQGGPHSPSPSLN